MNWVMLEYGMYEKSQKQHFLKSNHLAKDNTQHLKIDSPTLLHWKNW